jgi:4-amino-4-deoxy-L-arabinose transferase-like glycosyltransferase
MILIVRSARDVASRGRRWLVAAIVLSLGLRLPFLRLPMVSDEGGYAYVAQRWLDGRGHLYDDLWVSRPQGIFAVYGFIQRTLGPSVIDLRLGAWLASVGTLIFVWRFARDWAGREIAALAAGIFALVAAAPTIEGFTANAEVFLALPSAIAIWLLYRQRLAGWSSRHLLIIGGLAGIATLLKPSGIVVLPIAIGFVWLEGTAGIRVACRRSALLTLGFVAGLAPAIIHGWLIGWNDFLFASVTYRIAHQSSLTASPFAHVLAVGRLLLLSWWLFAALLVPLWGRQRALHGRLIAALPGGFWGFVRSSLQPTSVRRRIDAGGRDPGGTLLRLWLLGCLGGIAMGGDWWAHYLIQIAGPLAIGIAILIRDAAPVVTPMRRIAFGVTSVALLLLPYSVAALGHPNEISQTLFHNAGYPYEATVGRYLQQATPTDATIYVAFNDAAIYYLGDRPSTYRYLFNQELLAIPDAEIELIAMLISPDRPDYVIKTGMPAPFPDAGADFWASVDQHYEVQAIIGPITVYQAFEGMTEGSPLATAPNPSEACVVTARVSIRC